MPPLYLRKGSFFVQKMGSTTVRPFALGLFVKFIASNFFVIEFRVGATEPSVLNDNNQSDCRKDAKPEHEENPEHKAFPPMPLTMGGAFHARNPYNEYLAPGAPL
jgi:hypothetical protein